MKTGRIKSIPSEWRKRAKDTVRDIGRLRKREPNILTFILYGLLYDVVVNLWKPFSLKFLQRLGGHELEISLLNALPGLVAAVVLLPGAALLSRFANKKKATAAFILISRAVLLAVAFIPMLPASVRPMMFVLLIALMNCPDALSQTSLQSFLGTVFEGNSRAQAITLRNKFGNAAVPFITITTGIIITFIPRTEEQRMLLYQLFFFAAFLLGIAEVYVFNRFRVSERTPSVALSTSPALSLAVIKNILHDKKFISFFLPILLFAFSWQAGWPLCGIYQVEKLQANEMWFAIFALASGLGGFATAGFWQKFIRKHGNTKTMLVAAVLLAVNIVLFPLSPNVYVMTLISPFGGFASLGLNVSMLNGVLQATPDDNRLVYLAFYNTALNLSLFLAPMFAHMILSIAGIYGAFAVVFAMRLLASGVIWLTRRSKRNQGDRNEAHA